MITSPVTARIAPMIPIAIAVNARPAATGEVTYIGCAAWIALAAKMMIPARMMAATPMSEIAKPPCLVISRLLMVPLSSFLRWLRASVAGIAGFIEHTHAVFCGDPVSTLFAVPVRACIFVRAYLSSKFLAYEAAIMV